MKIDEFLKDEKNLDKAASQDGSLNDDALEAVAGGKGKDEDVEVTVETTFHPDGTSETIETRTTRKKK